MKVEANGVMITQSKERTVNDMTIVTQETLRLIRKVRDEYPQTYEWAAHKAAWEHITLGAVFMEHIDYIQALMDKEDGK